MLSQQTIFSLNGLKKTKTLENGLIIAAFSNDKYNLFDNHAKPIFSGEFDQIHVIDGLYVAINKDEMIVKYINKKGEFTELLHYKIVELKYLNISEINDSVKLGDKKYIFCFSEDKGFSIKTEE